MPAIASMASSAGGPGVMQGLQAGVGLAQTIIGGIKARKAQRQLEGMVNGYRPNESIMDFYNKALSRYNQNPYNSTEYQTQMNNVGRNMTAGIAATADRRGGLSTIGTIAQGANDASRAAVAGAEASQRANLGVLGQATGMKAQEDFKPFEMRYNLTAMKADGANQMMNTGIQNVYGALGSKVNMDTARGVYGQNRLSNTAAPEWGNGISVDDVMNSRRQGGFKTYGG